MIFNLFKSKPTIKELIPKGFVDIHSHILPGIDDGAKNVEESLKLISEMKKLGFKKIIGTPHTYPGLYNNTNQTIRESFNKISSKIDLNLEVSFASEYMLESSLIDLAASKKLLCLKNNFILVEMSYISAPLNLYEIIFKLKLNGYEPILAHPERYSFLKGELNEFEKLKKAGCFFQLNLLSLVGYYGNDVLKTTNLLLENNLIDFVGSDFHNIKHLEYVNRRLMVRPIDKVSKIFEKNKILFR